MFPEMVPKDISYLISYLISLKTLSFPRVPFIFLCGEIGKFAFFAFPTLVVLPPIPVHPRSPLSRRCKQRSGESAAVL